MTLINKVNLLDKYAYGCGNLAYGIILQVITSYFLFFATSVLHISGSLTGIIIFISVLWDAITDPIMGYVSDNTYNRVFGKRHLYMIVGAAGLAISNALLWGMRAHASDTTTAVLLFTFMFLCKTFITIYSTPFTALGAEMSSDYDERTTIQSIKSAFFLIGIALPMVGGTLIFFRPTPEFPQGQLNPGAYLPLGLATSAISIICALICIIFTLKYAVKRVRPAKKEKKKFSVIFKEMVSPLKLPAIRSVIFGYLWQNVATAIVTSLFMHIFTYTFHLQGYDVAIVSAALLIVSVLSQVYWIKRAEVKDKKGAVIEAIIIALISCGIFFVMVLMRQYLFGKGLVFIPFAMIIGFAMGGMVSIPQTMLVDTIDLDECTNGRRQEGTIFGCMTFFYKLSQSITLFFLGIFLDLIGFNAQAGVQSVFTNYMLGLSLPVFLFIALFLAYKCFAKYPLTKAKVEEIQAKLKK